MDDRGINNRITYTVVCVIVVGSKYCISQSQATASPVSELSKRLHLLPFSLGCAMAVCVRV